jgi:Phage integrase family
VHRIIARIGAIAGIDDMHPHRLRHTLATQAINRGMRLEAIAALLGHRSLEMTLVYANITDRVVADTYASVCEQIDALYATANTPGALPAEIETAAMTRLRQERNPRASTEPGAVQGWNHGITGQADNASVLNGFKERAVRMVRQLHAEIGQRLGTIQRGRGPGWFGVESLRMCVNRAEIDAGETAGVTTAHSGGSRRRSRSTGSCAEPTRS